MNSDDWNDRYAATALVWGEAPNRFVAAEAGDLPAGRALDLACGEGRNAAWLAERGWVVTAIDYADVAIERARGLAARRGVGVDFRVGDVLTASFDERSYDLVLIAYLQLPPDERRVVLERAAGAVAPAGRLLLVGHDLRNHTQGHGGPKDPSLLWTAAEITETLELAGLEIERAGEVLRDVVDAPRPAIDTLVRARRPSQS